MSKIKEYKRNLVILVASHYLGEPEEGDLYDTYLTLLDAPKDDLAMNHIDNTWEQMEYVSVGSLVELIEVKAPPKAILPAPASRSAATKFGLLLF